MGNDNLLRRTVLKTATFGGISPTVLTSSVLGSDSDDTVEIVAVQTGDEYPNKKKEVPEEWYKQLEAARGGISDLVDKHGHKGWFKDAYHVNADEEVDGWATANIVIGSPEQGRARKELPDEVNGVAVEVRSWTEPKPDDHIDLCDKTEYTDCLPGGAWIQYEDPDGNFAGHSWTCQVQYGGDTALLTAAHGFNGCDCDVDITGHELLHHDRFLGNVVEYDNYMDFAVVDDQSDINLSDTVTDEDYSIIGTYTKDGLEELRSNGDTVYHYGARTCRTSGVIERIYPHWGGPCGNANEIGIRSSAETDGGDSGGIHYNIEQFLVVGRAIAVIAPHYGAESEGIAAYRIEDEYDISFSPSNYCG